jgi:hypothetical protein
MGRYAYRVFAKSATARYCVLFNLQWQIIECQRLEPASDLRDAMMAALARLAADGWQAEGGHEFGFAFIRRGAERRLLILTERNPHDTRAQAFSPFI